MKGSGDSSAKGTDGRRYFGKVCDVMSNNGSGSGVMSVNKTIHDLEACASRGFQPKSRVKMQLNNTAQDRACQQSRHVTGKSTVGTRT